METLSANEVHQTTARVRLDHLSLKDVVGKAVAEHLGIRYGRQGQSINVTFEEETAGSPPYRIGTRCIVEVKQDLMSVAAEAEEG